MRVKRQTMGKPCCGSEKSIDSQHSGELHHALKAGDQGHSARGSTCFQPHCRSQVVFLVRASNELFYDLYVQNAMEHGQHGPRLA